MNDDVVNVQTELICSGFHVFWLDPFNGPIWEIVNLSHVWNTSIQYKSPEREKVIVLAYNYFL